MAHKTKTHQPTKKTTDKSVVKKILVVVLVIAISLAGLAALASATYKLVNSRTYQLFGTIIPRVETTDKKVALTFDDGPTQNAQAILDALAAQNAQATFYIIGQQAESNPDLLEKIVDAGHQVGNHSYSHQRMVFKTPAFIIHEVDATSKLIREAGYEGEMTFRPPYGKKLLFLPWYLHQQNITTITWDIEPETHLDQNATPAQTAAYIKEQVKPGSIILLHPWYKDEQFAVETINATTDMLQAEGYELVTVNELLGATSSAQY